jgi:hypothetical protein
MKFLAKYISLIFAFVVILPVVVAWTLYFLTRHEYIARYFGWSYSFSAVLFCILALVSFLGSVIIVILNKITKKFPLIVSWWHIAASNLRLCNFCFASSEEFQYGNIIFSNK